MSCAAAVATIEVLEREGLYDRAVALGDRARARLRRARRAGDRRGAGHRRHDRRRAADKATAEAVQQRCLDDGVLVLTCGPDGNVLRLIPPLTMTDAELDHGLAVLTDALTG